jgi:hypothetical protein
VTPESNRALLTEYLLREARKDPAVFNRLVYRDSRNGKPWEMQEFQREWEEAIEAHDRIVIFAPMGHAKTESIARSWLTRKIAQNPELKAAVVCNKEGPAVDRVLAVRGDIESNPRLHAVYPHLKPGGKWLDSAFTVERGIHSKDPTLQAVSVGGDVIGARLDVGVVDDPVNQKLTLTHEQRKKVLKWFLITFETRFDGRGKIVVIMTSWHENDLGHMLVKHHGYHEIRMEACDANFQNILWPEKFPEEMLRHMQSVNPGPVEFARGYRNIIMDDSFRRIKMEWIQKCLDRGLGLDAGVVPQGATAVYCGVDPAGGRSKNRGDFSALFTFATMPNGDRYAIDGEEDRITSPELRSKIMTKWNLYHPLICVESNGVQIWLEQEIVAQSAIQIESRDTGRDKSDPSTGVESIGNEMNNAKWIIPSELGPGGRAIAATPGLQAWVDQMTNYELGAHTGDMLMACYVARCVAREKESCQPLDVSGIDFGAGLERKSNWR